MNQQQLEILKDLIIEKLSEEGLDQKTRAHLKDMLTEIKEEMKVLKAESVDEMFPGIYNQLDKIRTEEVDEMIEGQVDEILMSKE